MDRRAVMASRVGFQRNRVGQEKEWDRYGNNKPLHWPEFHGILPFLEYDVDGFLGLSQKIHMPEQVLQTGRAVCSGYAHLCQEMCR